jgi:hypothetical protein
VFIFVFIVQSLFLTKEGIYFSISNFGVKTSNCHRAENEEKNHIFEISSEVIFHFSSARLGFDSA